MGCRPHFFLSACSCDSFFFFSFASLSLSCVSFYPPCLFFFLSGDLLGKRTAHDAIVFVSCAKGTTKKRGKTGEEKAMALAISDRDKKRQMLRRWVAAACDAFLCSAVVYMLALFWARHDLVMESVRWPQVVLLCLFVFFAARLAAAAAVFWRRVAPLVRSARACTPRRLCVRRFTHVEGRQVLSVATPPGSHGARFDPPSAAPNCEATPPETKSTVLSDVGRGSAAPDASDTRAARRRTRDDCIDAAHLSGEACDTTSAPSDTVPSVASGSASKRPVGDSKDDDANDKIGSDNEGSVGALSPALANVTTHMGDVTTTLANVRNGLDQLMDKIKQRSSTFEALLATRVDASVDTRTMPKSSRGVATDGINRARAMPMFCGSVAAVLYHQDGACLAVKGIMSTFGERCRDAKGSVDAACMVPLADADVMWRDARGRPFKIGTVMRNDGTTWRGQFLCDDTEGSDVWIPWGVCVVWLAEGPAACAVWANGVPLWPVILHHPARPMRVVTIPANLQIDVALPTIAGKEKYVPVVRSTAVAPALPGEKSGDPHLRDAGIRIACGDYTWPHGERVRWNYVDGMCRRTWLSGDEAVERWDGDRLVGVTCFTIAPRIGRPLFAQGLVIQNCEWSTVSEPRPHDSALAVTRPTDDDDDDDNSRTAYSGAFTCAILRKIQRHDGDFEVGRLRWAYYPSDTASSEFAAFAAYVAMGSDQTRFAPTTQRFFESCLAEARASQTATADG